MYMLEKSFGYQLNYLKNIILDNYDCQSPEGSFAEYIFQDSGDDSLSTRKNRIFSELNQQKLYQAPTLATVGYKIASNVEELDLDLLTLWEKGFSRLATKETFTIDRTSFFYRPIELLGICLGATRCPKISSENLLWLKSILQKGENKLDKNNCWSYLLGNLAASSLDVSWTDKSLLIPEDMAIEELALVKLVSGFYISISQVQGIRNIEDKVNEVFLERCLVEPEMPPDIARAAIVYCSLKKTVIQVLRSSCHQHYKVANDSEAAIEFIDSISDRFNLATQQLKSQSEINLSKNKLQNIDAKLSAIESNAKAALGAVKDIIKQKTSDSIINNQLISLVGDGNSINMNKFNFNAPVGSAGNQGTQTNVAGLNQGTQIGTQHNSSPKQTLAEAAEEIHKLLKQLKQDNPDATEQEKIEHINDETTPKFKRKVVAALKAAGNTAIDEFLDNSYVKVGKAAIMSWIES